MNKEEKKREYNKKYHETHKEQTKEYWKKYYDTHKDERKKYYETHKDEKKKYYETHKEYIKEQSNKYCKYQRYFRKNFSRFITLQNYLTIMKLGDESLLRSIMVRLSKGTIDQDEAVALSGMTFTNDDLKEMNEWIYNICRCKSTLS